MNERRVSKYQKVRSLTPREFQIFKLLGAGWNIKRIAGVFGISRNTVYSHIKHMVQKLGADDLVELLWVAIRWRNAAPRRHRFVFRKKFIR